MEIKHIDSLRASYDSLEALSDQLEEKVVSSLKEETQADLDSIKDANIDATEYIDSQGNFISFLYNVQYLIWIVTLTDN